MKKILLLSCLILSVLIGLGQAKEKYPRQAVMTGKLELTNPSWKGLIEAGYLYSLRLEEGFLPYGVPELKDGVIVEPNIQVSISLRIPKTLRMDRLIGKKVTVYGLLNCPFSCYMEVEKIEPAE
ncbi:MAG: hypothetical protein FJ106_03105 [Deltaproteobacteria bacterium]|nr:hypothetical protein [Deltaproteobacteria bacterium]